MYACLCHPHPWTILWSPVFHTPLLPGKVLIHTNTNINAHTVHTCGIYLSSTGCLEAYFPHINACIQTSLTRTSRYLHSVNFMYIEGSVVWYSRVTYPSLRLYVCPPIQEEGDGGMMTILSSLMEGGRSILEQGHTERHADKEHRDRQVNLLSAQIR